MDQKPNWKTVWNCHILDKLYFVHKNNILDTPIMIIEVEERVVMINHMSPLTDVSFKHWSMDHTYYLNKADAELELKRKQDESNTH